MELVSKMPPTAASPLPPGDDATRDAAVISPQAFPIDNLGTSTTYDSLLALHDMSPSCQEAESTFDMLMQPVGDGSACSHACS